MKRWLSSSIVIAVTGYSLWAPTEAHAVPEFIPIQERAEGQSLAGSTTLNDSLYTNPAGSSFTNIYSVEGTYNLPRDFAVSILDTKTSTFGGGLGYFKSSDDTTGIALQGVRAALASKVSDKIGLGIGGKFLWGTNILGGQDRLNDGDIGALFNLKPVQLGLTLRNVFGGNANFDQYRELALGGRITYDDILYLNAAIQSKWGQWNPYQYGIGVEYDSPYYFSIKGGFRIQPSLNQSYWSMGASLLAPKINITYAVEIPTQTTLAIEHTLAASVLF